MLQGHAAVAAALLKSSPEAAALTDRHGKTAADCAQGAPVVTARQSIVLLVYLQSWHRLTDFITHVQELLQEYSADIRCGHKSMCGGHGSRSPRR